MKEGDAKGKWGRRLRRKETATMCSFSISHPTRTRHWWHLGLSRTRKGRKSQLLMPALAAVIKYWSGFQLAVQSPLFRYILLQDKRLTPLLLLYFTSPFLINYSPFVLLVLSVPRSPCLIVVLALAHIFSACLCWREWKRANEWHYNK